MNIKLSCYCCGGTEFTNTETLGCKIENHLYLDKDAMVKCEKCGLKDYVKNLVPKVY